MKYSDLDKRYKHFLNGKISQYMDAYIRQHKVWTPEQMHADFFLKVEDEISKSEYARYFKDGIETWTSEYPMKWLMSEQGKALALEKFKMKYEKDKPIADRNSPLVERVRFGFRWADSKYFDLSFGLKNGYNFIDTKALENLHLIPWSIKHVNEQLNEKNDEQVNEGSNKQGDQEDNWEVNEEQQKVVEWRELEVKVFEAGNEAGIDEEKM